MREYLAALRVDFRDNFQLAFLYAILAPIVMVMSALGVFLSDAFWPPFALFAGSAMFTAVGVAMLWLDVHRAREAQTDDEAVAEGEECDEA